MCRGTRRSLDTCPPVSEQRHSAMQHTGSSLEPTDQAADGSSTAVLVDWIDEDEISALDEALHTALASSQNEGSTASWHLQLDQELLPGGGSLPSLRACTANADSCHASDTLEEPLLVAPLSLQEHSCSPAKESSSSRWRPHAGGSALLAAMPLPLDGCAQTEAATLEGGAAVSSGPEAAQAEPLPLAPGVEDIEDVAGGTGSVLAVHRESAPERQVAVSCAEGLDEIPPTPEKRVPLLQHRRRRGLSVTDLTASEWCERQVDFALLRGAPKKTPAMHSGAARHAALEAEIVEVVEVRVASREDSWAVRLLDTAARLAQLRATGLAREVYV